MIVFDTTAVEENRACPYCGLIHIGNGKCPSVKAIEYHPNGTIKRVEFFPALPTITLESPAIAPPYVITTGSTSTDPSIVISAWY